MVNAYTPAPPGLQVGVQILAARFPTIYVGTKIPHQRLPEMFIVDRVTSHGPVLVVDAPRLLVQVWAPDVATAEQNANDAVCALENGESTTVNGTFVYGFYNLEGPYNFPDPEISDQERWQFQGDLWLLAN